MKNLGDKLLGGVLLGLIALALVGGLVEAIHGADPGQGLLDTGSPAPAFFAIRHADGKPVNSDDLKGKVVVLDFWGTWCPPCREEAPVVRDVARAYAGQAVEVLAFDDEQGAPEPQKEVAEFLAEKHLEDYPVAYPDPSVMGKFRVNRFPTLYVIGRDGKVAFRGVGEVSERRLHQAIDAALKG